jgi:uncharacterized membrane protein YhaH (DUF805 family)
MAVLKADPNARRKLIYIILIFSVLTFIIFGLALPEFESYLKQKQSQEALKILCIALSIMFLSALCIPAYFYSVGHRILKAGQYPWPGMKVMHDTKVVTGNAARRKAYIAIILSYLMALLLLYGGVFVPYSLYKSFENQKIEKKLDSK